MIPKGYRISALLVFLLICASGSMIGIENQRNYFRSPVSYPITLSGAFGEIRRNHFHSGIDIRTDGVQEVYAIPTVMSPGIDPAVSGNAFISAIPMVTPRFTAT